MARFFTVVLDCILLTCSVCGISDAVYGALNGTAIQCSFSSLNLHTVRSDGLFASLRCLIPKQGNRFEKLLELTLIGKCFDMYVCLRYRLSYLFRVDGYSIWLYKSSQIFIIWQSLALAG